MGKSCVVVGAGIAGIASAIRIAARGYKVDVYEANDHLGGKIRERHIDGFRFDMGPSVLTQPYLIDELFRLAGKNPQKYFNYQPLKKTFKYFFEDKTSITAYSDINKYGKELESKTRDKASSLKSYLEDVAHKYAITKDVFIENSIHKVRHLLNINTAVGIANFKKIEAFKSMNEGNRRFFKDPKVIQLMNSYASYVGSNPFIAPATLNMIQHLEINQGIYLPEKGIYHIVSALTELARDMGVKFHTKTTVDEIIVDNKVATGVRIGESHLRYDRVVSNMDVHFTYHRLLPKQKKPRKTLEQPKSSSILAFYWGVKRQSPELEMHNMLYSRSEEEEYKTVFEEDSISDDPTIYIGITSKYIKEDAPEGHENWYVFVTAPNNKGQDWDYLKKTTRANILQKIKRMLDIDLEPLIVNEGFLTPKMIESKYLSAYGSIYGNSSNNRYAAFLRHANFTSKIKHLYFAGGSVHPGAGIPMCLNSARIMDKLFK